MNIDLDMIKVIYIVIGIISTSILFYNEKDDLGEFTDGGSISKNYGVAIIGVVLLLLTLAWPVVAFQIFIGFGGEDED